MSLKTKLLIAYLIVMAAIGLAFLVVILRGIR
jgi:hypothetical protein